MHLLSALCFAVLMIILVSLVVSLGIIGRYHDDTDAIPSDVWRRD